MEYSIEEINVDHKSLYIKGWVHENKYKLKIVVNNKIVEFLEQYESRYDVSLNYKEKIENNNYGFNNEIIFDENIKYVDLYVVKGKDETKIYHANSSKFSKTRKKLSTIIKRTKNFIKMLWREHHFLVPPKVMKGYIKGIIYRNRQSSFYNPNISTEYNEWLSNQKYINDNNKLLINVYGTLKNNTVEESSNYIDNGSNYSLFVNGKVELVEYFNAEVNSLLDNDYDIIYFDNDLIRDGLYVKPNFKPNWSIDTLMGINYVGNAIIIKNELIKNMNTRCIYELLLNCRFKNLNIFHLQKIMYHDYNDFKNQIDVVKKYIKESNISATVCQNNDGISCVVNYKVTDNPLVSIIIPTKDHSDILEICLKSLYSKTIYKNYEVIVINNNSVEEQTFDLLNNYSKKKNFKYITINEEFNYSRLNNEAIRNANGDYVLLLNNDIEIIDGNWLNIMLSYAQQKHIGTVGAKLLFPDNTIQHAGIIMGKGGIAGHSHYKADRFIKSNQYELSFPYDVSGCTAACLLISKEKYNEVNGLEEQLKVAFNDVDFNLKVLKAGYYNVFLPNIELYHHESKSRGIDSTPEKQKRFMQECQFIMNKWGYNIEHDDYYNDNLSKDHDYMIKGDGI